MSNDRDTLVLDAIAGRRPNGKGRVRANCPFCAMVVGKADRKQCLELNVNGGWWKCYRCESGGRVGDMPFDLATVQQTDRAGDQKPPVVMPDGFVPLWKPEGKAAITTRPGLAYLEKRGVGPDIIAAARIGACVRGPFAGRVVVPIYRAGKLAGYVGRAWRKKAERKYMYNAGFERAITLYNEEALYVTTREPVIIVEGVFDTFPFWPDACAVLGKPSEQQIEMMTRARRPIAIVLDGDAWREGAALAMGLRRHGKEVVSLRLRPGVDPDEIPDAVRAQARAAFAA